MLNHGRNPRLPSALTELTDQLEKRFVMVAGRKAQAALRFTQRMQEDIRQAKGYLKIAQQRMKAYSDIGKKERTFQVGDKVLLSTRNLKLKNDERTTARAKLLPKFIGPYEVTQVVGKVAYKIELPGHCRLHPVFHVSLLFPYNDPGKFSGAQASPQPLDWLDKDPTFTVGQIADHQVLFTGGRRSVTYLIEWAGFAHLHDTWEPEQALREHIPEMLKEYQDSHVIAKTYSSTDPKCKRTGKPRVAEKARKRRDFGAAAPLAEETGVAPEAREQDRPLLAPEDRQQERPLIPAPETEPQDRLILAPETEPQDRVDLTQGTEPQERVDLTQDTEPQHTWEDHRRYREEQEAGRCDSEGEPVTTKNPRRQQKKRGRPPGKRAERAQAPAQAPAQETTSPSRDKNYLGPRKRKVPLKFNTMHMYRVTIEALEAQAGIRLCRGPTREQESALAQAGTSLEHALPRGLREAWAQQMEELGNSRKRKLSEGPARSSAIRRHQERSTKRVSWAGETSPQRIERELLEEELIEACRQGLRVEV